MLKWNRKVDVAFGVLVALMIAVVAMAQRPLPSPSGVDLAVSGPKGGTFVMNTRDTSLTESFKLVSQQSFTQMAVADSVRFISTSTADSSRFWVVGIASTDTLRTTRTLEVSGTDTIRVPGVNFRYLEAVYADSESAGTVTFHRKTGATTIVDLSANDMSAAPAHHFFSHPGGGLFGWEAKADPESPVVHLQLRLYREHQDAVHTPETGYLLLDEMYVGGAAVYHPHVSKQLVAGVNDTSVTFSVVGTEKVGYFSVVTDVGTSITAMYIDVSSDRSRWKQTTAIDSTTGVDGTTQTRAEPIPVDSLYGQPWARLVVNNRGTTGDTATVDTYITVHRNPGTGDRDYRPFSPPETCPPHSYVAVYARAIGKNGRVFVRLRGYDNPMLRK